jgi:hypothetical protein
MTKCIEDLTPFFQDRCWMVVLLARQANVGIILRRGPNEWWRLTLWDTKRDAFEAGQWFRGRLYPEKCDVSPNGKLFIYFAGKFSGRSMDKGYSDSWTAVSRPPYLTALALWPIGGTYGGSGLFVDDRTVLVGAGSPHHPDHPPGPLRLMDWSKLKQEGRSHPIPSAHHGWQGVLAPGATTRCPEFRKPCGELILGRDIPRDYFGPSRRRTLYTIYRAATGEPLVLFEAHWADWDQNGRLVATVGGRVLSGKLDKKHTLTWCELASMHEEQPERIEAPRWAQRW